MNLKWGGNSLDPEDTKHNQEGEKFQKRHAQRWTSRGDHFPLPHARPRGLGLALKPQSQRTPRLFRCRNRLLRFRPVDALPPFWVQRPIRFPPIPEALPRSSAPCRPQRWAKAWQVRASSPLRESLHLGPAPIPPPARPSGPGQ